MNVVWLARQADAECADHILDRRQFAAQTGTGLREFRGTRICPVDKSIVVDGREATLLVDDASAYHD